MKILNLLLLSTLVFFWIWVTYPKISSDDAIDAIVGEASNQSYDTMVCVAQAIRHRNTLKGVYGFHAKHNYSEDSYTWEMAENAWNDSVEVKDQVNGAKNFGTIDDLHKLKIKLNNIKASCGDFLFY